MGSSCSMATMSVMPFVMMCAVCCDVEYATDVIGMWLETTGENADIRPFVVVTDDGGRYGEVDDRKYLNIGGLDIDDFSVFSLSTDPSRLLSSGSADDAPESLGDRVICESCLTL